MTNKNLVLVINSGSSSVKFSLYDTLQRTPLASGLADRLGTKDAYLKWHISRAHSFESPLRQTHHLNAIKTILAGLKNAALLDDGLAGIGHRVVHGGELFDDSAIIDTKTYEGIEQCAPLAPLHNPANLVGIDTLSELFPNVPQVAVFDTAFHQTLPKHAYLYALPYDLYTDYSVRRYGFHGTSHDYVAKQAVQQLNLNPDDHAIVCAHLGNGCSATAIKDGESIDTTMGFTPLEGLCMGTRSGDIDPSIIQFLCRKLSKTVDDITNMLNKSSGLLGVSQSSNDMRNLTEAAQKGDEQAQLAIDVFCYKLAKHIAALCVPLGKLDALVFTGGIGENAANIRAQVCRQLSILNIHINEQANNQHGHNSQGIISQKNTTPVAVIATDEEWYIAQATQHRINSSEIP